MSGYNIHRRARQLHDLRLQAGRGRVRRAADVQAPGPALGARRLARGDAGRLLRDRHGHVEGRPHQLPVSAAVRVGAPDHLPDTPRLHAARRRRVSPMVAGARERDRSRRSKPGTRRTTLPGLGAEVDLPAHPGHRRTRLAHVPGLHAPRRLLRRHAARLPRPGQGLRLPDRRVRGDSAPSHPARDVGAVVPRPRADRQRKGRPADAVLHAAGAGRRLVAARLFSSWRFRDQNSLLLQAEWRIMVNRYLDLAFFYDAGKVTARTIGHRFRRAEGRLRRSASASTARSPRRCASSWRGAAKAA